MTIDAHTIEVLLRSREVGLIASGIYDEGGNYLLQDQLVGSRHRLDPAWPGISHEPQVMHVVFAGDDPIPCARSFVRHAEPRHYDQIREMLAVLPERRLTQVVGYGDGGDWRAFNEDIDGPGYGDWTIHRADDAKAPVHIKRSPLVKALANLKRRVLGRES